eukprot:TRINITY_DN44714_c0_g1_i1.p1 TRINITY_DN44714_c0_g1~~TRINITY_DN44714_c0_g1_i1.p1  ORF type:complete len:785 (+),score=64.06 TRINITY_DN44714_c0_g1_i1:70-2424(+)
MDMDQTCLSAQTYCNELHEFSKQTPTKPAATVADTRDGESGNAKRTELHAMFSTERKPEKPCTLSRNRLEFCTTAIESNGSRRPATKLRDFEGVCPVNVIEQALSQSTALTSVDVENLVRSATQQEVAKVRRNGMRRCIACVVLVSSICVAVFVTVAAIELTKRDSRVNSNNEMVTIDGNPIRTSRAQAFSTLADLPVQSPEFLENIRGVSIHIGSEVAHYRNSGFRWSNASYMELETTRGRDIIIASGKAFIRDNGKIIHFTKPASVPECGRRLGVEETRSRTVGPASWDAIVDRYHTEISSLRVAGKWRRLNNMGMGDMYEWFGALISSDVAVENARSMADMALQNAACSFDTRGLECAAYSNSLNPRPPVLSGFGFNKFVLSDGVRSSLLYIDLSDWIPSRGVALSKRVVRSKFADGVSVDTSVRTGSVIRVTETQGTEAISYQMPHPSVVPGRYNMSVAVVGDKDGEISMAEAVLESSTYGEYKGECLRAHVATGDDEIATSASSVAFDCEMGTFTWLVSGWRLQTLANGSVVAFVFANASGDVLGSDDSAISFTLTVKAFIDGHRAEAGQLSIAFRDGSLFSGCDAGTIGLANSTGPSSGRRLGYILPGSNWCGPGQCLADRDGCRDNYCLGSYDGDWACRRHDACAKSHDYAWGTFSVLACSCDRDLYENRGSGPNAAVISSIYGGFGVLPCISHEKTCDQWGWVRSGRRRRWGWSYWGVVGHRTCEDWNYINKYDDPNIVDFGYRPQFQGHDVHSREDWHGCVPENKNDFVVPDLLR